MNPNKKAYHGSSKNSSNIKKSNYSNQMNPNNYEYSARMNNRANQLNPNNKAYHGGVNFYSGGGGGGGSAFSQSFNLKTI